MKSKQHLCSLGRLALSLCICAGLSSLLAASDIASVGGVPRSRLIDAYGRIPLSSEQNQGQAHADVKFGRRNGISVYLAGQPDPPPALERAPHQVVRRSGPAAARRQPEDRASVRAEGSFRAPTDPAPSTGVRRGQPYVLPGPICKRL